MVMASEVGVYETDPANVALKVRSKTTVLFLYMHVHTCHIFKYKYFNHFAESIETRTHVTC